MDIANSFRDNLLVEDRYRMILDGLQVTLLITLFAALLGTLLGGVVCWARMSRRKWLQQTAKAYINLMRGTPVLVLLMLMYYVFMAPLVATGMVVAIVTFSLNVSAYVGEMLRVAIGNIDRGQMDLGVPSVQYFAERLAYSPRYLGGVVSSLNMPENMSTFVGIAERYLSAWHTQVSYTHCEPLPKSGKPEVVRGSWEVNDGILQHTSCEEAPLAICKYLIPSDHYTIECTARKDGGPEGFIIVFNYVDAQNYCWLNFGTGGNTQCTIEQISDKGKILTATRPGSVDTGKWYGVKLTVAGDNVKAWLDDELIFDEMLKSLR